MSKDTTERRPKPEVLAEIREVVGRAKKGDAAAVPRLRQLLNEYPEIWQAYGDLARQVEAAWAGLAAGTDLHLRECLLRKAEVLRAELAGTSPSPAERLLVERVVALWLKLTYFDGIEAMAVGGGESPRLALYRARRQSLAQREYIAALAALATLRRLIPAKASGSGAVAEADATEGQEARPGGHDGGLGLSHRNRLIDFFERTAGKEAGVGAVN